MALGRTFDPTAEAAPLRLPRVRLSCCSLQYFLLFRCAGWSFRPLLTLALAPSASSSTLMKSAAFAVLLVIFAVILGWLYIHLGWSDDQAKQAKVVSLMPEKCAFLATSWSKPAMNHNNETIVFRDYNCFLKNAMPLQSDVYRDGIVDELIERARPAVIVNSPV